jgi:hypothetical protein
MDSGSAGGCCSYLKYFNSALKTGFLCPSA